MADKKPKEITPIPPDRFNALSAADRNTHLEELGRQAMIGKAKWIEKTGVLGRQVEAYKAATSQSERRSILRNMGEHVQNSYVSRNFKSSTSAKPRMTVREAFGAAKIELGRGGRGGGGSLKRTN